MRQIKFRAWDIRRKKMIDWGELIGCHDIDNLFGLEQHKNKEIYYLIPMQFTGLKDKNGKEIYEGDIVNLKGRIGLVFFSGDGYYEISNRGLPDDCEISPEYNLYWHYYMGIPNIEIIGNIYENKDLLEVKE